MSHVYSNRIKHPERFLWDAWSVKTGESVQLFALSLERFAEDGSPIRPQDRNQYPHAIYRFETHDQGQTWHDRGIHRRPDPSCSYQAGNVWSGSVALEDGNLIEAFTGIKAIACEHPFVQSLCVARLNDDFSTESSHCLISSERDYEVIRAAGYYLQAKNELGYVGGEEGGCITAWRDPFVFTAEDKRRLICFAAKNADKAPAMGLLEQTGPASTDIRLYPPITMPDSAEFTQLEVPKIEYVPQINSYVMLCATTNRVSESQPGSEVAHEIRLYTASSPEGPWAAAGKDTSVIAGTQHLFGATIIDQDQELGRLVLMAPYTTDAGEELQLTFASRFFIDLDQIGQVPQIHVYYNS